MMHGAGTTAVVRVSSLFVLLGRGGVHVGVEPGEAHNGGQGTSARREGQASGALPDGAAHEGRQSPRAEPRGPGSERCKV